jgi:hypothetical protein
MHGGNAAVSDGGLRKKDKKDLNDPFAVSDTLFVALFRI